MKFFGLFFLLVLFISSDFATSSQMDKNAKKDAKHYCQCLNKLERKTKKLEKKAERLQKKRNKNYRSGDKLFGGYTLDFDLEGCVEKKRNRKGRNFIKKLSEEDKKRYQKKVKSWTRKKCPRKIHQGYF